MADYLKNFETTEDYNTYINGNDVLKPNVSYIKDNNGVYYNPIVPPSRVIRCTINVETISNPTVLCYENGWADVESVLVTRPDGTTFEITYDDLVQYDPYEGVDPFMSYQFDTIGNHILEYTLESNVTELSNLDMFDFFHSLISVEIPNCITTIGSLFGFCDQLTTVIVPSSVTSFGASSGVFWECSNLSSLTILSTTPPTTVGPFDGMGDITVPNIYVPNGSVDAYKAADGWKQDADKIFQIPTT